MSNNASMAGWLAKNAFYLISSAVFQCVAKQRTNKVKLKPFFVRFLKC
jgi:hypothetical protein